MTLAEIEAEIDAVRNKIMLGNPGSIELGNLVVALVALYDMYFKAVRAKANRIMRKVA